MEKIQAAIAKARAARSSVVPEDAGAPQAPTPVQAPAVPPDRGAVEARWAALSMFEPDRKHLTRNHVVTAEGGRDALHFDQMRTRVLQQMRTNNWRRLAITSPGPGCGKSTVAMNLAFSLARQAEQRAILVEMDLRRPSLAKMLGLRQPQSFARVLDGSAVFADHAVRLGMSLAVTTNQSPWRNPAELMHSPSLGVALDQIEADYDPTIMIFDLPPMLSTDDAMAVAGKMDCVLLLAAAETTTIKQIDTCERDLASQTNVMGVVLNKCRYMEEGYGYDYYSG